jgi:UDPglucose--hexose-1-phosphate uridylyltransferase
VRTVVLFGFLVYLWCRMSEIRRDPLRGHWTIIAHARAKRPSDFSRSAHATERGKACPFCPGNERLTPDEVMAVRPSDDPANHAGWSIRVIPNKYPAVYADLAEARLETGGLFERVPALGAHELVILTPEHDRGFAQISVDHWDRVLAVCQHRMHQLWQEANTQHVALFLNHGPAAGASREHPHLQIVSAPVSAPVSDRMHAALKAHYKARQTCMVCDIVSAEVDQKVRIVEKDKTYITIAPFASRLPYELWVIPRAHRATFLSVPAGDRRRFAAHLRTVFGRLTKQLGNVPFNAILHSARPQTANPRAPFHWHFEIAPRLSELAGLEWGSGAHINPVAPEAAAAQLKG